MNSKEQNQEKEIIEALQPLKETPARDPVQAAQGRKDFLAEAKEISEQTVSISPIQRLINVFTQPKTQPRFSTLTIGILLGLLFLTFSSSTYAARKARPDQFLYPYKLWLENSMLLLANQSDQQIDLHLDFAEERLKELATENQGYSPSGTDLAIQNFSGHIDAALELLDEYQDEDNYHERLDQILQQYQQLEESEKDEISPEDFEEKEDAPEIEENISDDIAGTEDDALEKPEDLESTDDADPESEEKNTEETESNDKSGSGETKDDEPDDSGEDPSDDAPEETEQPDETDEPDETPEAPDSEPSDS